MNFYYLCNSVSLQPPSMAVRMLQVMKDFFYMIAFSLRRDFSILIKTSLSLLFDNLKSQNHQVFHFTTLALSGALVSLHHLEILPKPAPCK